MITTFISKDSLKEKLPSIFAKDHICSDRYSFIDSEPVIDSFNEAGWGISRAQTMKSKLNKQHCKHLVAFRNRDESRIIPDPRNLNKPMLPEILLMNSSDGSSCLEFMAGIYAMVCSNGLIVMKQQFDFMKRRHINLNQNEIFSLISEFTQNIDSIQEEVDRFSKVYLADNIREQYVREASSLRFGNADKVPTSNQVTSIRRQEDTETDLWTLLNVAQENLIKGGIIAGKRRTRELKAIDRTVELNKQLWDLTNKYATTYAN